MLLFREAFSILYLGIDTTYKFNNGAVYLKKKYIIYISLIIVWESKLEK